MEEIPLVFPSHAENPRRYVIDVDAKRLKLLDLENAAKELQQFQSSASASSSNAASFVQPLDEALLGAASVSSVNVGGQELLLTTSALIDKPSVISVALSWKKLKEDILDSPATIEIETKDLRVVAVRAFASDNGIDLVFVSCLGSIIGVSLDANLHAETDVPLKVLNRRDYVPAPLLEQVRPSSLQGNMISFLPSKNNLIVMALAPLILTIDWKDTGHSSVWSETQCKDEMSARTAPFTGMITNLPSLILGKIDADVVDMAPAAALCVSTNTIGSDNENATAVLVFSLHSDASVRKWMVDPDSSMSPIAVSSLDSKKLALPSTWSDGIKSIALCSRLYEQNFALAVHIKTNTISSYNEGLSDCNVWVFEGNEKSESMMHCHVMKVPNDAVSLVGMSFSPSQRRCTLSVVFESMKSSNDTRRRDSMASGIKFVNYPPSLLSIVSSEPEEVDTMDLDKIATTELSRLRSLPFGSIVMKEIEEGECDDDDDGDFDTKEPISVEQALNKVDSLYMKHLFRPIFPRGNGTVLAPSEVCIRRALSKLVHGAIKEHGMSVELETIKTLYEWRNRDKRKFMTVSPSKMSRNLLTPEKEARTPRNKSGDARLSVYESFVEPEEDVEGVDVMIDNGYDEFEQLDEELFSEIETHESRWQRLLYQIWEEEQILLSPQCVSWLESLPVQILVRGNVITTLTSNGRSNTNRKISWKKSLEETSKNLLELIEADHEKSKNLYEIEEQLTFIISNAQLSISPHTSIIEGLTSLGRWAQLQGKTSDDRNLRKLVSEVPVDEVVAWIEDRPSDLGIFSHHGDKKNEQNDAKWNGQQVAKVQLRHASCSCAIRATDFIRRSRLGKCILLLELAAGSRLIFAAFRAYVQSIAILWTSAQRIKTESAFRTNTGKKMRGRKIRFDDDSPRHSSPPTKRSSFGDNTTSILMPSNSSVSTTLDVVMIRISQELVGSLNATSSPLSAITMLSGSFVDLIFASKEKAIDGARKFMPELCVLPKPQSRDRPTDHPNLALRLLAPYVAFEIFDDSPESVAARKEELSSCLLHAALSNSFTSSQKSVMRERACDLLVPKNQDYNNPIQRHYTEEGLNALNCIEANVVSGSVDDMRQLMHSMIPNATSVDIMRLCELATAKHLFKSYASAPNAVFDDATRSHAVQIATLMLRLSQILHRLSILERYVNRSEDKGHGDDYNSESLLQLIADAIADMEATFPEDFLKKMPEYTSIWTRKFNHAVRACRWNQAYNACVKNPLEAHRENNFNRLVRAMIDSGALNELLDMCTQLGVEDSMSASSESIDLYEIASSVLLTYADCDVYDSRATSSHNTNLSDYQGALYALHASQEQWRRAAQSLDLRYVNAEKALRRFAGKSEQNVQTSELRDGLIVQDLVLSACGSANSIQLVRDHDYRFLVSGEYGKFSVIQSGDDPGVQTPNKLKRGRSNDANSNGTDNEDEAHRLSNFMVGEHLDGRAMRSLALRTLFFDRSTSYTFAKSAFRRGIGTSQIDIDELFKNGYYQYGLLLAKAQSMVYQNGKSKPEGSDIFGNYLSQLMGEYLVPLTFSNDDMARPTLQQLQLSIDTASTSESAASYIATERSLDLARLEKSAMKAAALVLLRELTMTHSTAETPLALDVAFSFLDRNGSIKVPVWLERVLLGVDSNTAGGGAFAPRSKGVSKAYLGDPSALLRLYTKRGMFTEACNVVTLVLDKNGRATNAASRLPEKGNIDCVPYHSIDMLWNLIEIACSKGAYDNDEKHRILRARGDMEEALKKHYELMQLSEMGLRSARILNA